MFEAFYNLRAEPFKLSPDHRICFEHKGYAKARAYMAYAFMRAEGFVMITGRPGTGKTTLIGDLIESLAADNVTTANLVCTQLQADDLLKTVAFSFGVSSEGLDKADLLQRLNVQLHNWHRDGRRALLIVDEAQDLSISAMEELRLLTNIQVNSQPLLQIFLLGQPELRDLVLSPEMEQVHQRIVAASHLEALQVEETESYIIHRLKAVGWQGDPALSKAIFPLIYRFSEGVPRRINLICSRLMLHGCVEQTHKIGIQDLRSVIKELQGEHLAAGNMFSEQDFMVEDKFEEVPVPQEEMPQEEAPPVVAPVAAIPEVNAAVPARGEVQLRAVGSEPAVPQDNPADDPAAKKKGEQTEAAAVNTSPEPQPLLVEVRTGAAPPQASFTLDSAAEHAPSQSGFVESAAPAKKRGGLRIFVLSLLILVLAALAAAGWFFRDELQGLINELIDRGGRGIATAAVPGPAEVSAGAPGSLVGQEQIGYAMPDSFARETRSSRGGGTVGEEESAERATVSEALQDGARAVEIELW